MLRPKQRGDLDARRRERDIDDVMNPFVDRSWIADETDTLPTQSI